MFNVSTKSIFVLPSRSFPQNFVINNEIRYGPDGNEYSMPFIPSVTNNLFQLKILLQNISSSWNLYNEGTSF